MNSENNNYNQNFNKEPSSNNPTQRVKNKFFNFDMDNNNNTANDVGSTITGETHNVISWGVGSSRNEQRQENSFNQTNNQNLVNQVNSDIFNGNNIEVLDDFMTNNQVMGGPLTGESLMDYHESTENNTLEQNTGWKEGLGTTNPQGTDWMSNQPLSAASLGGTTLSQEEKPKDVVEESRFFNANINDNQQNNQEPPLEHTMQYGNGSGVVLDDPPPVFDEMALLKQFIGGEFTKLSMSVFSFSTLIFGSLIFLHRKIYIIGIIFTLIEVAISSLLPLNIAIIALLVIHIILALMINPMYIKMAKRKVKKIMNDKKNAKMNQVEMNCLCHKKGQNNLLIAIIIYMICSSLIVALSYKTDIKSKISNKIDDIFGKTNDEVYNNDIEDDKETENKESPEDDKEKDELFNVEDYIYINLPGEFIKEDTPYYSYYYVTGATKEESSCEITIKKIDNVEDIVEYANNLKEMYNIDKFIEKTLLNNILWYTFNNTTLDGKTYYRIAQVDDIPLILEYKIGINSNTDICERRYSTIISSISIKRNQEN